MICYKCGEKLSLFNDDKFVEKLDGKTVVMCRYCHDGVPRPKKQELNAFGTGKISSDMGKKPTQETTAKGSAAFAMKIVATIILVAFTIGGGILGYYMGDDYDDVPALGMCIGAVIGFLSGYLASLFLRYFAELGENTKIIANASAKQATSTEYHNPTSPQQLVEYKQLLDQGIITQEEFDAKKRQILGL